MNENDTSGKSKNSPRLYTGADLCAGADIALPPAQAHYLIHVMRLGVGDGVRLFNGRDGEWDAAVAIAGKKGATLRAEVLRHPQRSGTGPWLLLSPLKKDSFDWSVEKATELGAARIVPVLCAHSVARKVNPERLQAIAIEAAEQCERLDVPDIAGMQSLTELLAAWPPGRALFFCHERGGAQPLPAAMASCATTADSAVLIGPEGGFSSAEIAALLACPFVIPVSLGPRILRAETAVTAALSVMQALRGDWRS